MGHRGAGLLGLLFMVLMLGACSNHALEEQTPERHEDALLFARDLEAADTIVLDKKAFSLGSKWDIKLDGEKTGTIEGKDLKAFGEIYALLSPKGGLVAGTEEKILSASRTAKMFDSRQEEVGMLTKKLLSLTAEFNLKDAKGKQVASLKQKFALSFKGSIRGPDGEEGWTFKAKHFTSGPYITLERKSSSVSAVDAMLMVVTANDVYNEKES